MLRNLRRGALGVGALDSYDVFDRRDLVEQALHGLLDGRIVDALVGAEHDRADDARTLSTELGIEDVEAGLGLDVGQIELVAERGTADGARQHTAEYEDRYPQTEHEATTVVTPGT